MADGTGVETEILTPAVEAELHRIMREAERQVQASYGRGYRPYLFRIIREVHPWITRDLWVKITGTEPDDEQRRARERAEAQERVEAARREADDARALLRQHGRDTCCPDCDVRQATALRRERGWPAYAPGAPVETPAEETEPAPERTCECDECTDETCQGDCDQCDDHGCGQCYADHEVSDCCGYCSECESHPSDVDSPRNYYCTQCERCSECEHYCG